ncbi:hypothetical protein AAFC00_005888 [Neodothiora populina]
MQTVLHGQKGLEEMVVREFLLPALHAFTSDQLHFQQAQANLATAVRQWLLKLGEDLPIWASNNSDEQGDAIMADVTVNKDPGNSQNIETNPLKRRKLRQIGEHNGSGETVTKSFYDNLLRRLAMLLGSNTDAGIHGLSHVARPCYAALSESDRRQLWQTLGACPCAGADSFKKGRCAACHSDRRLLSRPCLTWDGSARENDCKEVASIFNELYESPELQKSGKERVLAMLAIRSFVMHTVDATYLDLNQSLFAQWCLRSLYSSSRELRIAAGRTLVAFLRENLPPSLRDNNRRLALNFLRTFSAQDANCHHETLILTWGQIAMVCGEEELNLALLRLVDYLGHPNSLVCALAFSELEGVSESRSLSPQALLRSYYRSIAIAVVQDIITKPQKIQQLAELLEMRINSFLVLTQRETIPFLVFTKKTDVLQRIAMARGPDTSIQDIILSPPSNLAAVLAYLLAQPSSDVEQSAMNHLTDVAPGLRNSDLAGFIKLDPVLIACEMLKAAADEDQSGLTRIYHAIQQFAVIAERSPGQGRASGKGSKMMASFFEAHVLGIMTEFTNAIEYTLSLHLSEKNRCIMAIDQMIKLAQKNIIIALPQIRACLQSAAQQKGLQDAALSAWISLVSTLDGNDVVDVLDQTFALVVEHWFDLSTETQQALYDCMGEMLKSHSNLIREKVITIPSLAAIPLLSKFESEIQRLKERELPETHLRAFVQRLLDDNASIVALALKELVPWLEENQSIIHEATVSEQPKAVIADVTRALLDVCTKYTPHRQDMVALSAQCLGVVGCLDPNRIDASSTTRQVLVLSNFEKASEVIDWVAIMLEDVIVPAFKSSTDTRIQGFMAWVMQELVRFCGFNEVASVRLRASQASPAYTRWIDMPASVRNTLTPFLSSRYMVKTMTKIEPDKRTGTVFSQDSTHSSWLQTWVYDMLWRGKGDNAEMLFPTLARVTRGRDLSIASFLLPYVALNIVLGGTEQETKDIADELLVVLSTESDLQPKKEVLRQCSENVFAVLDYMSKWVQEKKRTMTVSRTAAARAGHAPSEFDEARDLGQISSVERVIQSIPADIIAKRAMECGSYARALYHWEYSMREQEQTSNKEPSEQDALFQRLHSIYAHIDEPDGLDGISAHLNILSPEQQAFQQRRAGRWSAAQSWYEIELEKAPNETNVQAQLLSCLRESGQLDQVLRYASHYSKEASLKGQCDSRISSFVLESSWSTGRLDHLRDELKKLSNQGVSNFDTGVAKFLLALQRKDNDAVKATITDLRDTTVKSMTSVAAASLQSCHDILLRLHAVYEMEALSGFGHEKTDEKGISSLLETMDRRLAVIGSYISDKQYLLGIRRAVMGLSAIDFTKIDIGSSWLTTARLARKANVPSCAHYAVLKAFECGDDAGKIEHARLLWRDGQHRQAIQSLEGAIASDVFATYSKRMQNPSHPAESQQKQNMLSARAHLLLAKWLDASGQTQTAEVTTRYQYAAKYHARWEKGHYYLGKHYNKILEAEKSLPPGKQSDAFVSGEMTKLVIENYLRSVPFGSKYWYQTIPKIITLWLDLGADCMTKARGDPQTEILTRRNRYLESVHKQIKKYFDRIPPYIFYNALPQMISRISHPNPSVYEVLALMISKIVSTHPSQALWSLLAVIKSSSPERANRGAAILNRLKDPKNRNHLDTPGIDLRMMIIQGQKLSDGLLQACDIHIESRASNVSLSKDLSFNHKLAPSPLVIPLESTLIANTPVVQEAHHIRKFVPFAQDKVTIAGFSDDVLVLSSLQRPRKLSVRGSDGKLYGLLCKPKDDLRKDQRLMEFNTMINRALKRDAETSKRRLYIKTYGVTPLSEESGTIEWVEGIKPLRDILLKLYQRKGIQPNYNQLRVLLSDASKDPANVGIFKEQILPIFPPVLYEWFAEMFPEPETWFTARIRYARSAAVMSMVGHVLGLGDRHGENILLQEGTGGVFHVDFNCLFDKGLTFEKPEVVPFRLTHNMVDAMGAYGYEGPFRKAAELTLGLLRQHQDTLMNILETFVYDPTTDFVGRKKRTIPGVPDTPQEVLDSVSGKLRGFLKGESVPLSVEGHVDALITQAVDPWNLCQMYIGWCAFL